MIEKRDLEAKFQEIVDVVDETTEQAKNVGMAVAIAVVVLLFLAFLLGRKRGQKGSAQVEIYRVG